MISLIIITFYISSMTCPRQHRHLKRKDSIRFLVLLVFSNFTSTRTVGKEPASDRHIRVKIYSKAAKPLSNLSYSNTALLASPRVRKCCPFNHSCFNFPRMLSIGALSRQFPLRLVLLMNPCSSAGS